MVVQNPKHSRMCGFGEKVDRRPIDPPPFVRLTIFDANGIEINFVEKTKYFMFASLCSDTTNDELYLLNDRSTRSTLGSLVSTCFGIKGPEDKEEGLYFVFPDISVRVEGKYRLKFTLFEIDRNVLYHRNSTLSETFTVYTAKKFPGMAESTPLTKAFTSQGLKLRTRNESRHKIKREETISNEGKRIKTENISEIQQEYQNTEYSSLDFLCIQKDQSPEKKPNDETVDEPYLIESNFRLPSLKDLFLFQNKE